MDIYQQRKTKDENNFNKMSKEYQDAYEKVIPIRDKCVIQINSKYRY